MRSTAKLFMNGASQAVRLPREFRFEGEEVCIKRVGSAVLLFPKGAAWDLLEDAAGTADEDFLPERNQPSDTDRREAI